MDATDLAGRLLLAVPANVTLGVRVTSARDGSAELSLDAPECLANVVGTLHAAGLAGIVDACGLAAVLSALPDAGAARTLLPLGRAAELRFLAPAGGALTARCVLGDEARDELDRFAATGRGRLRTETTVSDANATPVCVGRMEWSLRPAA